MKPSLPESIAAGRKNFLERIAVSHETAGKLDRYVELLIEWNEKFNLVSASTIPDVWTRHILDSAQLKAHIRDNASSLVDIGSGAGFPGLVLSVLGMPDVHLIESTGKKTQFLNAVVKELELDVKVHHARAEDIKGLKADVVTARAVAPLGELLKLARPFLKKDTVCLFLKGKTVGQELAKAKRMANYACEQMTSESDPSGSILLIHKLAPATYRAGRFKRNKT